jgi:hypothetical protein
MAFELGKWSASAVGLVCHPAYIPWRRASQRANMPVRELADRIVSNAVKETRPSKRTSTVRLDG